MFLLILFVNTFFVEKMISQLILSPLVYEKVVVDVIKEMSTSYAKACRETGKTFVIHPPWQSMSVKSTELACVQYCNVVSSQAIRWTLKCITYFSMFFF